MEEPMKKRYRIVVLAALLAAAGGIPAFCQETGTREERIMKEALKGISVGDPAIYDNLTIFPLVGIMPVLPVGVVTLDEALSSGWLVIEEVKGGTVPVVHISNLSEKTVFLMGGEILSGCKQDRIVSRDLMIKPYRKKLRVPVYCVEQGRWTFNSKEFSSEQNLGAYWLRSSAQVGEEDSQYKIWSQIADANRKMNVESATGAYQDAVRDGKVGARIEEAVKAVNKALQFPENTVGAAVCIGDYIASVDLFGGVSLFEKFWPKILKSSALSACASDEKGTVSKESVVRYLKELSAMSPQQNPGIDLGKELRMDGDSFQAGALVYKNSLVHLGSFADPRDNQ
jgi:hypothetical protein